MAQRPGSGSSSTSSTGTATDTSLTKIFVGGLAWETQCDSMKRYFEQFGEIVEAVVIVDKHTGRSKGYGFVTFREPDAARRACANPAPFIDGRRTNCNLAVLGAHRHRSASSPLFQGTRFLPGVGDFSGQGFAGAPPFGHPLPFAYHHHQGAYPFPSSPLGYPSYPPEYYAPPNVYSQYVMGNPHQQIPGAMYPASPHGHVPPSPTFQHPPAAAGPNVHEPHLHAAAAGGGPFAMLPASPLHLPSYFLPAPFMPSPGHVSPSGSQGPSTPRLVLQAPPFTPGSGSDQQSSG